MKLAIMLIVLTAIPGILHSREEPADPHAEHRQALATPLGYSQTTAEYVAPRINLLDSNGDQVVLAELLGGEHPVLMQFIFTSCSTICPVLSASFSKSQDEMRAVAPGYRMVSVSIDPEYDTPTILKKYAQRNKAQDGWVFLTGSKQSIGQVMRAFDVLYPADNKMYHQPYTFLRTSESAQWVRFEGFLSAHELVAEYQRALALNGPEAS